MKLKGSHIKKLFSILRENSEKIDLDHISIGLVLRTKDNLAYTVMGFEDPNNKDQGIKLSYSDITGSPKIETVSKQKFDQMFRKSKMKKDGEKKKDDKEVIDDDDE